MLIVIAVLWGISALAVVWFVYACSQVSGNDIEELSESEFETESEFELEHSR